MKHFKRETNAHGQVMTPCCSACRCPFSSPSWWLSYPCFWFWLQSSANLRGSISTVCCLCWAALYFISFLSTTSLDGLRKSQVSIKRGTAVLLVKRGKPSTPLPHLSTMLSCHGSRTADKFHLLFGRTRDLFPSGWRPWGPPVASIISQGLCSFLERAPPASNLFTLT